MPYGAKGFNPGPKMRRRSWDAKHGRSFDGETIIIMEIFEWIKRRNKMKNEGISETNQRSEEIAKKEESPQKQERVTWRRKIKQEKKHEAAGTLDKHSHTGRSPAIHKKAKPSFTTPVHLYRITRGNCAVAKFRSQSRSKSNWSGYGFHILSPPMVPVVGSKGNYKCNANCSVL